jgi:hypothetical protein
MTARTRFRRGRDVRFAPEADIPGGGVTPESGHTMNSALAPAATTLFRWLGQPRLLHAIGEDRDRDRGDEEAHGN